MLKKPSSRRLAVCLALAVLGVSLTVLLVTRSLDPPVTPDRVKIVVESVPREVAPQVADSDAPSAEAVRSEVVREHMVEILVTNPEGQPLMADVTRGEITISIQGSGWIADHPGILLVSSAGHIPRNVSVEGERLEVVLQPACSLHGIVFDIVTGSRVIGASVSVETAVGGEPPRTSVTDGNGEFLITDLPPARVVVHGQADGYVPFCEGPETAFPGIGLDVRENLRIEIPLFPIYVALSKVQNSTNLQDDVLGALLICRFAAQPGSNLPQWLDQDISNQIAEVAESLGITQAYGQACCLEREPDSLSGRVDFVVRGQSAVGSAAVIFQPLQDFLLYPAPSIHNIDTQWDIGALTVEAPITLRVAAKAGIVFGGLQTTPGSFTCELPYGKYVVSPLDLNPLLDSKSWTREVEIPEQDRVAIAPAEGFATLELVAGRRWPGGVVSCTGSDFSMGIPLKNLPVSMPASPGTYRFSVMVGSGKVEDVVWRREVTLDADESTVLRIGDD